MEHARVIYCSRGDISHKKFIVSLPAINEQETIGSTIAGIREQLGKSAYIIVCVANEGDPTVGRAIPGADAVLLQPRLGYGLAHRTSICFGMKTLPPSKVRTVILSDADGTYDISDLALMNDMALEERLVIGSRLANGRPGKSMRRVNYFGNRIITFAFRALYGENIKDTQSGLKVFPASIAETLASDGMEFSSECVINSLKAGLGVAEVPVVYHTRLGVSKLRVFKDFIRIMSYVMISRFVMNINGNRHIHIERGSPLDSIGSAQDAIAPRGCPVASQSQCSNCQL